MTYKLEFLPSALKEWEKLGHTVREQAKKNCVSGWKHQRFRLMPSGICLGTTRSSSEQQAIDWSIGSKMIVWL